MKNILMLRSVEVAIDEEGWFYELERKGNGYRALIQQEPIYHIEDTVVEWYDELNNYDLMRLTMWVYMYEISTPYNFR